MTALMQLKRLEQRMSYVRWFATVFAVVSIELQPYHPVGQTRRNAWLLAAVLLAGSFTIWAVSVRMKTQKAHARLGAGAFVFDCTVVAGFVWLFAFEEPYVTWALLFIVPMEGALRYRLKGSLTAAGGVAAFFVVQSLHRADLMGTDLDVATYVFVVALAISIGAITGVMAEGWHTKSMAFEAQSLELAELDRLKDRFLDITSHEIRGPLTAIIAGLDTVRKRRERLTPEQSEKLLEMVSSQAIQLASLVDDLQVTSQLRAGQLHLEASEASLEEVVDRAVDAAAAKRRQHHLELFVEPAVCEIDSARVAQIIRNLVENAYKYTPDGTRVSVTAKTSAGELLLQVSDQGPGIPAEYRDMLFEAFSRIAETSAGREGVGLGLYVVSRLVDAMGGRIDLASSSRGTTFTIHIPAASRPLGQQRHLGLAADR